MKVIAVIVTYYPDKELLEKNIQAFVGYVDKVVIWENTPEQEKLKYRFLDYEKLEYVGDGINSISHGLNYVWRYARDNHYDYILTMDQDSVFHNFKSYLENAIKYGEKEKCLIGPEIAHGEVRSNAPKISVIDENNHLITSGMLVPVSLLDEVGGYCEDLSVEAVDLDLCIRATNAGYRICCNSYGKLMQSFGIPYTRKLFWKTFVGANYNSKRLYGIFRNHMILYRRYKSSITYKILKRYLIHFIPRIILWEEHKCDKLKAIACGLIDGICFKLES